MASASLACRKSWGCKFKESVKDGTPPIAAISFPGIRIWTRIWRSSIPTKYDITNVALLTEPVYLGVVTNVFTRCIRGWNRERNLDHELILMVLRRALRDHRPEIHHSDQGVQYAAVASVETLEDCATWSAWTTLGWSGRMAMRCA